MVPGGLSHCTPPPPEVSPFPLPPPPPIRRGLTHCPPQHPGVSPPPLLTPRPLSHCPPPFSPIAPSAPRASHGASHHSWGSLPPFRGSPHLQQPPPPFPLSHHLPISRARSRCHPGPHRAPIAFPIHPGVSPHFHPHLWGLPSQTPSLGVSPVTPSAPRASPIASHCSLGSLPLPPWCPGVPPGAPPPVLRALFPFPPPPQGLPHCTPPLHHSFPFLPEISPIVCPTVQGSLPSHILF